MKALVSMRRWSKNPPFGRLATVACVALAFCLFAWGLQYKLSLYDPPQAASHHAPTAKLLSKNEQSGSTESPLLVRTRTSTNVIYTVPTLGGFMVIKLFPSPLSTRWEQRAANLWHLRRAYLRTNYVRPPPVLA
jgi:hypothetical protein